MNLFLICLFNILRCVSSTITAKVIPNDYDGVWWDSTYELNSSYSSLGQKRLFHVVYPSRTVYSTNAPIIIFYHGGSGNGMGAAQSTLYGKIASPKGFYTVFAEGYEFQTGKRKWSGGSCCGPCAANSSDSCYIDDIQYTSGVMNALRENHYAGPESLFFASGTSNGAEMTYRLTVEMPVVQFAGIAPSSAFAGWYDANQCLVNCNDTKKMCYSNTSTSNCHENSWNDMLPRYYEGEMDPVPIMTFHGYQDAHIIYEGGACTDSEKCIATGTPYVPYLYQALHNAEVNGCDMNVPPEETFFNVSTANTADYSSCFTWKRCNFATTYCTQYLAGHAWPGSVYPACEPPIDQQECNFAKFLTGPDIDSMHTTEVAISFFQEIVTESTNHEESGDDSRSLSNGGISGIVVSICCLVVFTYFYFHRRVVRTPQNNQSSKQGPSYSHEESSYPSSQNTSNPMQAL